MRNTSEIQLKFLAAANGHVSQFEEGKALRKNPGVNKVNDNFQTPHL